MKTQETKKTKELIKFLKKPLKGKLCKALTQEDNKILLDYIEDLESKNKEKIILTELEKFIIEEEKINNQLLKNKFPSKRIKEKLNIENFIYNGILINIQKLKEKYK